MHPYENLKAWQVSYELGLEVVRSTATWPKHELYGLGAQARRAATSVALNIAEGGAKRGRREFRRYLDIALGSLAELSVILRFALDLEYLSPADGQRMMSLRERASQLTWRLYEATRNGSGRPQ